MPFISVVIPCYNSSNYIVRCLEALDGQSYINFDVYLVDDCSTDKTRQVIEDYRESSTMSITVLSNYKNCGPAESRTKGIFASDAEFICFCDSDDWYDIDYLKEMVNAQSVNNADVVFCSYRLVIDSGVQKERLNIYDKNDLLCNKRVLIKAPDSLCLTMVRRNIITNLPQPNIRNGEDMALIPLIISKSHRFSAVNKCLYNYSCREDSSSMTPSMKVIESLEQSFSFIQDHLDSKYQEEVEYIGIRNLLYGALINLFKFSYDTEKANQIVNVFEASFPMWYSNPNIHELPLTKRIFLSCIYRHRWFMAKAISIVHGWLLR